MFPLKDECFCFCYPFTIKLYYIFRLMDAFLVDGFILVKILFLYFMFKINFHRHKTKLLGTYIPSKLCYHFVVESASLHKGGVLMCLWELRHLIFQIKWVKPKRQTICTNWVKIMLLLDVQVPQLDAHMTTWKHTWTHKFDNYVLALTRKH